MCVCDPRREADLEKNNSTKSRKMRDSNRPEFPRISEEPDSIVYYSFRKPAAGA